MPQPLRPGLYDRVIDRRLRRLIDALDEGIRSDEAELDTADVPDRMSRLFAEAIRAGLASLPHGRRRTALLERLRQVLAGAEPGDIGGLDADGEAGGPAGGARRARWDRQAQVADARASEAPASEAGSQSAMALRAWSHVLLWKSLFPASLPRDRGPMAASHRHKLDHDLSTLLDHHRWAGSARFPVVITTSPGSVHQIADYITANGGRVRHVMPAIHSVSAWVTLDLLGQVLPLEPVVEVDLAQRTNIAAQ